MPGAEASGGGMFNDGNAENRRNLAANGMSVPLPTRFPPFG